MSVVTEEYLNIQKEIIKKQAEWQQQIINSITKVGNPFKNSSLTLFAQADIDVDIEKYRTWILELTDYLSNAQPNLRNQFETVNELLSEEILKRWVEEVNSFNEYYFATFAQQHKLDEWIPQFLAEHAIRPYVRAVSKVYEEEISDRDAKGTCPCCGEPIRLALLEGNVGRKVIHCPRCYAHWNEKRLKCSHCGRDNDEKMTYLEIEGNSSMQIHTCQHCNGYVKVIDVRQLLKKQEPALLDLNTIHLDIIAQERGFGVPKTTTENLM